VTDPSVATTLASWPFTPPPKTHTPASLACSTSSGAAFAASGRSSSGKVICVAIERDQVPRHRIPRCPGGAAATHLFCDHPCSRESSPVPPATSRPTAHICREACVSHRGRLRNVDSKWSWPHLLPVCDAGRSTTLRLSDSAYERCRRVGMASAVAGKAPFLPYSVPTPTRPAVVTVESTVAAATVARIAGDSLSRGGHPR
jgi:hypothetical protein